MYISSFSTFLSKLWACQDIFILTLLYSPLLIIKHFSQVVGLHTLELRVCQWSGLRMFATVNDHQSSLSYGSAHELSFSSVNPWEHFSSGK